MPDEWPLPSGELCLRKRSSRPGWVRQLVLNSYQRRTVASPPSALSFTVTSSSNSGGSLF
ncbi:hypothetical protein CCACVL1_03579 [Corchorus capsularis]|uniref:Uncharacterized protein n=2 Tax=Corchorus capsularis TaxID=210143 RepID=A0A1R3JYG4_COCAP|nr:hypothetical protein CCACVL1_03579 [Corchorus capsularis]